MGGEIPVAESQGCDQPPMGSARRPVQGAATQHMHVQMKH